MSSDFDTPFQSPQITEGYLEPLASEVNSSDNLPADETIAVLSEVPPPWSGRVLTPWHYCIAILNRFLALLSCLPLVGFSFLVALRSIDIGIALPPPISSLVPAIPVITSLMLVPAAVLVMFAIMMFVNLFVPFTYEDRSFSSKLKREIRSRPESYIATPASSLCQMVAIVPEDRWKKPRLWLSADVAIMWIDPYSSRIYLEGDQRRYCIPAGSLLKFETDFFRKELTQVWYVHLTFRTANGPQELYLRPGEDGLILKIRNQSRQMKAEQMYHRIELLIAEANHRRKGEEERLP